MNILQILPELNVGGVETGTVDLAKHLTALGHKAIVVSYGGELVKELESAGIKHYKLAVHKKSIFHIIRMIPKLAEIIRNEEIDIVHARSRVPAWIAYFACRRARKVFITTCHGYYRKHFFSYSMGWAKRVIVLSNVIARHMIDDFDVPRERICLVPRSVDLNKYKYISPDTKRKDEFHIGIVGRITPLKGHLYFIKAMAKVARVIPRLKIWIVGDAPPSKLNYKEQVQVLVRRLGLWHTTEFLGIQRDIPAVMANLDLLVLATTTQEAFGRVIVEAQASGVPVVATQVGGVVDIIEDLKTGLLVPPADVKSMADAALKIYHDPQLSRTLAEAAYQKVKEKYSVELMVAKTIDVYQEALNNYKVLIIKLSSLGDIILITPAIRAIKEKFGQSSKLTVITDGEWRDVLINCPYIDELVVSDFKHRDKGLKGLFSLGRRLRRENFDIAIDLQNNRKSHMLAWVSMAMDRYGYKNKKFGFLLNKGIKNDLSPIDPVAHQFRVLQQLGITLISGQLELWPTKEDQTYVDEFLNTQWLSNTQRLVGINISASKKWQTKQWPLTQVARLCELMARKDLRPVITGTSEDILQAEKLSSQVSGVKLINVCGKTTINQLACLIRRCSVYVSADSAPLHIAASQQVPLIALFGPTDYRRHMPPVKNSIIIGKELICSPCYKPKCKHTRCMEAIKAEEVLAAIERLLKA